MDAFRIAARRGDQEFVRSDTRYGAIVQYCAVVPQHQRVSHLAGRQRSKIVDVQPIEKLQSVRSTDLELAKRRGVKNSRQIADRMNLRRNAFRGTRRMRVVKGPQPTTHIVETRAHGNVCSMTGQPAFGPIPSAYVGSGRQSER